MEGISGILTASTLKDGDEEDRAEWKRKINLREQGEKFSA